MKLKKIMSILLASVMFMSIAAVPAFAANTQDSAYHYVFNQSNGKTDFTPSRDKTDNTAVYIKATPTTLPYHGFEVQSQWHKYVWIIHKWCNASRSSYNINDYAGHIIKSDNVSESLANQAVRIKGTYSDTTYTWGDVDVLWSPDTQNQWQYSSLN